MMSDRSTSPMDIQLEFTQAMTDFQFMFPNMDTDVIEEVLRANQGAVDTTIDQLLAMSADNESLLNGGEGQDQSPPPAYQNNLPSYQQAVTGTDQVFGMPRASSLLGASSTETHLNPFGDLDSLGAVGGVSSFQVQPSTRDMKPLHRSHGWKPPQLLKLPSDFLRIMPSMGMRQGHAYTHPDRPTHQQQQQMMLSHQMLKEKYSENQKKMGNLSVANTPEMAQMLEDERIALMFQNEEFMAELRGNQEFMSTLDLEETCEEKVCDQPMYLKERKGALGMEDAVFREKLKNMGKTSKQKFAKLANMFSRQRGAQKLLGHAPAPSKDNLLLNAEPLVAEDSDTGESGDEKHSTTMGRKYQLM